METKHRAECAAPFVPRPQVPQQSYCSTPYCHRERRRKRQRLKLQTDPDYQENQAQAQRAWIQRNPDYWRGYMLAPIEY